MFQKAHQVRKSAFVAFFPACCQILPEKKPPLIWMSLRGAMMAFCCCLNCSELFYHRFLFFTARWRAAFDRPFLPSVSVSGRTGIFPSLTDFWRMYPAYFFASSAAGTERRWVREEWRTGAKCWWISICTVKFLWWKMVSFFLVCACVCFLLAGCSVLCASRDDIILTY